jgi:hypothetical protein
MNASGAFVLQRPRVAVVGEPSVSAADGKEMDRTLSSVEIRLRQAAAIKMKEKGLSAAAATAATAAAAVRPL